MSLKQFGRLAQSVTKTQSHVVKQDIYSQMSKRGYNFSEPHQMVMKGEDHHHAWVLGDRWRQISAGGITIIGVYFMYLVWSGAFSEHHDHDYHHPKLAHLRQRRYPMPWGDCGVFEMRCWRKEGEFAEEGHEH